MGAQDRLKETWDTGRQPVRRPVPHAAWGILILGICCYAAFLTLRGLWLGPLFMGRFGFSLVESGNVALALSLIALSVPGLFGRADPGRRQWMETYPPSKKPLTS
nr:hypothetical protein [Paracidovorax oryzae]